MFKKKTNVVLYEEKMSEERNRMYQDWLIDQAYTDEVWPPVRVLKIDTEGSVSKDKVGLNNWRR